MFGIGRSMKKMWKSVDDVASGILQGDKSRVEQGVPDLIESGMRVAAPGMSALVPTAKEMKGEAAKQQMQLQKAEDEKQRKLGLSRLRQRQTSRAASLIGDPSAVNTTLLG